MSKSPEPFHSPAVPVIQKGSGLSGLRKCFLRNLQDTGLISVDDDRARRMLPSPLESPAVVLVYMPVQKIERPDFHEQLIEAGETSVRKIFQISIAGRRRMGDKKIDPAGKTGLSTEFPDARSHLSLGVHVRTFLVFHRSAQSRDSHSSVIVYHIFDANAPIRRFFIISRVMISPDIEQRAVPERHKKLEITGTEISAGNDQFYSLQFVRREIIP